MTRFALVTGGAGGVGSATARALTEAGWTVAITGRNQDTLDATAKDIGGDTFAVACDVGNQQAVRDLFRTIVDRFGRLDLLFNNAGVINPPTPFEDTTDETVMSLLTTNVAGVFYCAQEAFRVMKAQNPQGGRIINNGSLSAQTPRPNTALYVASKQAVTGITKSLALDGRSFNIATGQVDIGNADTSMASIQKAGILQANGTILEEPTMNPRDVADAIVYMAGLPLGTNVPFITVMANGMPWAGRG